MRRTSVVGRRAAIALVVAAVTLLGLLAAGPATGSVVVAPSSTRFTTFTAPPGIAQDAGEPSIGANLLSGAVLFQAGTDTAKVTFTDRGDTTDARWDDVTFPTTGLVTLDPILYTDGPTGRTFVSQLATSCSVSAVTTNDGASWTPSQGCSLPGAADHQTVGGGRPVTALPAGDTGIIYYCSQDTATALCGTSLDGGLTFGPGVPIYTLDITPAPAPMGCAGLHGHVKLAPDGTAYVPNFGCGNLGGDSRQAVVVSQNDGATWSIRRIPDSLANNARSDPAATVDAAGKLYFGYEDASGRIKAATSTDKGVTWTPSQDVGAPFGVVYGVFPAMTSGSAGRASLAFIGATKPTALANDYENSDYDGIWHLYVSSTTDGGATWSTTDVTPNDPVQKGCVYWGNGTCPSEARNLLDFMDITHDKDGRVLVGYADGCVGACVTGSALSRSDIGVIARQTCGPGVLAAGDAAIAATCDPLTPTANPTIPEAALPIALPALALAAAGVVVVRRRRHARAAA